MHGLGMPGGVFKVAMTTLGDDAAKPWGIDNIEFLISANPGQAPQSLAKIASGGELSRMSLSIQVIASESAAAWPRWSAADCRNLAPTGRFYA
jgi:DNA repair protein RecN (Recombination protein N)